MTGSTPSRVVLVSGGGSGIGESIVHRLAGEGYCVGVLDLEPVRLSAWADTLEDRSRLEIHRCDVASDEEVERSVASVLSRWGRLDALITVAGLLEFAHAADTSCATWERLVAVNMTGTFLMCRAALPHLLRTGGCIVTTSSTAALAGLAYGSAYAAAKGGIIAYTRALAVEYAKRGVRVNCVCPGAVDTPMTQNLGIPDDADFSLIARQLPLTAAAKPDALAGIYSYLISADAAHMTGEIVRIDGGMLA